VSTLSRDTASVAEQMIVDACAAGVVADFADERPVDLDEAAGAQHAAGFVLAIEPQPRHAAFVSHHVSLAGECERALASVQVLAERDLSDRQRHAIPGRSMAGHVAAGVERHARRPAYARLYERTLEAYRPRREGVEVPRGETRMSVAAEVIGAQLVAHDEQEVAHRAHASSPPNAEVNPR